VSNVSLTIQKYLSVVDARRPGWAEEAQAALEMGNNFFVILPNAPDFLEKLGQILEVDPDHLPKACGRKRLFSLISFIEEKDFDRMLAAQDEGTLTCFIEQIDLPRTRPERVKPFLVYCSVRGIVSQHDSQREARDSCAGYAGAMSGLKNQHEATVYKWRGADWYNTETC
jgi:hypothetical protein